MGKRKIFFQFFIFLRLINPDAVDKFDEVYK